MCAPYPVLHVAVMHVGFSIPPGFSRGRTDLAHFTGMGYVFILGYPRSS